MSAIGAACIGFGDELQAEIAIADGEQAGIMFGDELQAGIEIAAGVQAIIAFGEGTCQ